jgi:serine/threonine-protein kinase
MSHPQLIGPPVGTTPAELERPRHRHRAIPEDILRGASQRLAIMSLLGAVLWFVGTVAFHIALWSLHNHDPEYLRLQVPDGIAVASVVLSLSLYHYARTHARNPRFVLDLGLVYLVLTGLAVGLSWHWVLEPSTIVLAPTISWIGPVCLIFAAIIPSTPGKTLVASLLAVSMNPLGMIIEKAMGNWDFGALRNVMIMHYPDYIMAGIAVVISHVMTQLGEEVARARELGSYQLGGLLGRGGMGEVYRATHRMLARPAAIKLIRPEMISDQESAGGQTALKRFRREAEVAASLRSPHTVQLYDFGVTEGRTFYLVMELLDGLDLETLVRQKGPLPAARVIQILGQVCESLEEAHASGLVHRDIKPANLHLGRVGLRYDFVKVLDFGLVKTVKSDDPSHSLATAAGLTPGTPAYMAPELAMGQAVDGRTDLYALGCVAYFLLTGQLVFDAGNGIQMIARHLNDAPVPPSQRTELPVPGALEQVVLACLAKRPDDRPAGATELARSLAALDSSGWSQEQAAAWWGVNKPG